MFSFRFRTWVMIGYKVKELYRGYVMFNTFSIDSRVSVYFFSVCLISLRQQLRTSISACFKKHKQHVDFLVMETVGVYQVKKWKIHSLTLSVSSDQYHSFYLLLYMFSFIFLIIFGKTAEALLTLSTYTNNHVSNNNPITKINTTELDHTIIIIAIIAVVMNQGMCLMHKEVVFNNR